MRIQQNHNLRKGFALYMAFMAAIVFLTITVACGHNRQTNYTEVEEYQRPSDAISNAHDCENDEHSKQQTDKTEEKTNTDSIHNLMVKAVALDLAQKNAEKEQHLDHSCLQKWILWGTIGFSVVMVDLCIYIYYTCKKQRQQMAVVEERAQTEEEIEEKQEKMVDKKHAVLFYRIKHELEDNKMFLDANLSRESMAEHLGTNRTYISEAIAQMTGMSFPQYISHLRIREAELRLRNPDIDVSNLTDFGRSLGFASLSAFQTAFKRQTGMTLSAYREIARK